MILEAQRRARNARRIREKNQWKRSLLDALGGACVDCGCTDWRMLSVDHKDGGGNAARRKLGTNSSPARWKFYYEQHRAGVPLEIRCLNCHALKSLGRDGATAEHWRQWRAALGREPTPEEISAQLALFGSNHREPTHAPAAPDAADVDRHLPALRLDAPDLVPRRDEREPGPLPEMRAHADARRDCAADAAAMTVGSLFSGIGGFDLGLERAGMTIAWQVENDRYCRTVLARHWPEVQRRGDIRLLEAGDLVPVDLICGGFPCQDVSIAGRGGGIDVGIRSGLWREFARVVAAYRPRWVAIENVPALRARGADRVLADLEAYGYAAWPLVVGAWAVGAPHRRDRVWIVAVHVADATSARREATENGRAARDASGALEGGRVESERGDSLADAVGDRARQPDEHATGPGGGAPAARGGGAAGMADAVGERCESDGRDRRASRAPAPAVWPAWRGSIQEPWEEPRTIESPLGRAANGVRARLASVKRREQIKALGNSIVPLVAEQIGRAILVADADLAGPA